MSSSPRISLSVHQITQLHIPEGHYCCTDGSENLKAPNFRLFLQTADRPLHGRPVQSRTAPPEAVSFVMTSQPAIIFSDACRPLQETISIFLVPEYVCVQLVGLFGPEIRPLQGITYRHNHTAGLQTVGTVSNRGRQYTPNTMLTL